MSGKRGRGRPSAYRKQFAKQAYKHALLGATDADLAAFFEVDEGTINAWKRAHPEFRESLKAGKDEADTRVARSLYRRALGYRHRAVKIFADAKTGVHVKVPYIEHYPPDPTSAIFWLKNRQSARWRDRQDIELTGAGGGPIEIRELSDADLTERARQLAGRVATLQRNGHGNGKH